METYPNLTSLLLGPIRKRPGMYLGKNKISMLPNFIHGYQFGYMNAKNDAAADDEYFGENGFIDWFCKKYNIILGSFWHTPFLELAHNDEVKALDLFFEYLEEYSNEKVDRK